MDALDDGKDSQVLGPVYGHQWRQFPYVRVCDRKTRIVYAWIVTVLTLLGAGIGAVCGGTLYWSFAGMLAGFGPGMAGTAFHWVLSEKDPPQR